MTLETPKADITNAPSFLVFTAPMAGLFEIEEGRSHPLQPPAPRGVLRAQGSSEAHLRALAAGIKHRVKH
jgi:hypothetical protein